MAENPWDNSDGELTAVEIFVRDHLDACDGETNAPPLLCTVLEEQGSNGSNTHFEDLKELQETRNRVDKKSWVLENLKSEASIQDIVGKDVLAERIEMLEDIRSTLETLMEEQAQLRLLEALHRPLAEPCVRVEGGPASAAALRELARRLPGARARARRACSTFRAAAAFARGEPPPPPAGATAGGGAAAAAAAAAAAGEPGPARALRRAEGALAGALASAAALETRISSLDRERSDFLSALDRYKAHQQHLQELALVEDEESNKKKPQS